MTLRLAVAVALALVALPALPAPAQFEGIADLKIVSSEEENKVEGTGKLYLTATAWRVETDLKPTAANPEMRKALGGQESFRVVVFGKASEPKKSWMLNDRTKTYSVVESDPEDRGEKKSKSADEWTVVRAGKDTVAGLTCEKVTATRKGEDETWDACLARDFLSATWMRALTEDDDEGWVTAAQRAGVKGYPVRMISRGSDGKEKHRFEVVKLERKKLPASLFEVPAGYRETGVMGTMAQTPEQQRQMEEAQKQMDEAMKNMSPEQKAQMQEMMKQFKK